MNLSLSVKAGIVSKIMRDVPRIDYGTQIIDYMQAEAMKLMPAEILAIYNNEELRPFLSRETEIYVHGCYDLGTVGTIFWRVPQRNGRYGYNRSLYVTNPSRNSDLHPSTKELMSNTFTKVVALVAAAEKQRRDHESMNNRLRDILRGIRTLKQAKTLLEPALHPYLPDAPGPRAKNTDASTALVPYIAADLAAMGWPKTAEVA